MAYPACTVSPNQPLGGGFPFLALKDCQPKLVLICMLISTYEIHIAKSYVVVGHASIRPSLMTLGPGSVHAEGGNDSVVRSIAEQGTAAIHGYTK